VVFDHVLRVDILGRHIRNVFALLDLDTQAKNGALSHHTLNVDAPAHQLADFLDNGESEARAAVLPDGAELGLGVGLEQDGDERGLHADTRISNGALKNEAGSISSGG